MLRLLWLSAVATAIIVTCQADSDFDQCNTNQCRQVGRILEKTLNYRIHPCEDFHMHTCGSRGNTRNSSVDIVDALGDLNSMESNDVAIFRNILEEKLSVDTNIKSLETERQIFRSCMTYGLRTEKDKNYYFDTLPEQARHLDHLDVHHPSTEHWRGSDKNYAFKGYGYAFFDLKIVADTNDERERYIQISPPTDNIMEIRSLLAKRYESQSLRPGYKPKNLQELINFLMELNRIAQQKRDPEEEVSPTERKLQRLTKWQTEWDDRVHGHETAKIDWKDLIKKLFSALGETIPNSDVEILVNEKEYFFDLIKLLSSTSMNTIENYVNLRYISKTIGLVDEKYFDNSIIPSINKLICTPGLFVGTAHAYAKKYFPIDNHKKLKEVFEAVRSSIKTHLGSISYNLEAASKPTKAFLRKLEKATVMYGYPPWLMDQNLVSNFYPERMTVNERYFNNEESVYQSVLKHNLKAYRDPRLPIIDIDQLFKAFTTDRIEIFEKNTNEIVIPVRLFSEANFKFFSPQLFDPMNYGSAAAILATEIYQKWLDTVADINNVTDCMKNHLPRDLTQQQMEPIKRRATAYLLGLRTAYEVWPNKDSYPIEIENFGVVPDSRLFFLSFAETLCRSKSEQLSNSDTVIIPSKFINAVLSNMEEFEETFVCDKGQGMTRNVKCDLLKTY